MSSHGHGGNPLFRTLGLLLLVALVVGAVIYFFNRFPIFTITGLEPAGPRPFHEYQLVVPAKK